MRILKRLSGFTLIELLVALMIVGILSTMAVPAYMQYNTETNLRAIALRLVRLSLMMEQQKQLKSTYVGVCAANAEFISGIENDFSGVFIDCKDDRSDFFIAMTWPDNSYVGDIEYQLKPLGNNSTPGVPSGWVACKSGGLLISRAGQCV